VVSASYIVKRAASQFATVGQPAAADGFTDAAPRERGLPLSLEGRLHLRRVIRLQQRGLGDGRRPHGQPAPERER